MATFTGAMDANGFPVNPEIDALPAGLSEKERYEFAFRVMAEQGDRLGDYLFAAIRTTDDHSEIGRWIAMSELMEQIHGAPIALTYRACDRMAADRALREV